jgi:hypothetical protein
MKNLTLAIDERLLEEGRQYAREHRTSLNALLRGLLANMVRGSRVNWTEDCFAEMDAAKVRSRGKKWKREELYRV